MGQNDLLNISKELRNTNDKIMFEFSPHKMIYRLVT